MAAAIAADSSPPRVARPEELAQHPGVDAQAPVEPKREGDALDTKRGPQERGARAGGGRERSGGEEKEDGAARVRQAGAGGPAPNRIRGRTRRRSCERATGRHSVPPFIRTMPPRAVRSPIVPISFLLFAPNPSTTWPRHARMRMGVFSE